MFGLVTFQAYRIALHTAEDLRSAAQVLKVGPGFLVGGTPFSEEAFGRVQTSIAKAVERVENANWAFDVVGAVPLLGRPVHAAEHLVRAASIELESIELARKTVADITGEDGSSPLVRDGQVDLETLARAADTLDTIIADLARVEAEVRAVKPIPFVSETARLKDQALAELARVRESAEVIRRGLEIMPDFFGANGRRIYLLAILNNAELHGVGGAFLSFGVVQAIDGRLGLVGSPGDPLTLDPRTDPEPVPAPPDNYFLNEIYPVHLVNALNGPDFAQGAKLASDIIAAKYDRPVDGVIAVDAVGLSYILPAVGPVRFPKPRVVLTPQNFVEFSTNAQYLLYPYNIRQQIQRATIEHVWGRIGSATSPLALLRGISRGLEERRVLLWSRFSEEQRLFQSKDWAGSVFKPRSDYFLLNHQNLGVDKLDYYLREHVRYRVRIQPNGDLEVEVAITLRNTAPPGLPEPVGNNDGSKMRTLIGAFVHGRAEFEGLAVNDDSATVPDGPRAERAAVGYGKNLYLTIVKIAGKSKALVKLRYRVPAGLVSTDAGRFYRLLVQHQPLVNPSIFRVELIPADGVSFGPLPPGWIMVEGKAVYEGELARDLYLSLPVR
jgi:hypothetical protein